MASLSCVRMSAAALAESGLTWPAEDNGVPAHAIFALKIVHAARQAQKGPSGKNLVADDFIELRFIVPPRSASQH